MRDIPRDDRPRTGAPLTPGPVATALGLVIARADALPSGDVAGQVQTCTHTLAAACMHRAGVREAVDRLAAAVAMMQDGLQLGGRRRAQHDSLAVERLLEVFQEELLPELRRQGLV